MLGPDPFSLVDQTNPIEVLQFVYDPAKSRRGLAMEALKQALSEPEHWTLGASDLYPDGPLIVYLEHSSGSTVIAKVDGLCIQFFLDYDHSFDPGYTDHPNAPLVFNRNARLGQLIMDTPLCLNNKAKHPTQVLDLWTTVLSANFTPSAQTQLHQATQALLGLVLDCTPSAQGMVLFGHTGTLVVNSHQVTVPYPEFLPILANQTGLSRALDKGARIVLHAQPNATYMLVRNLGLAQSLPDSAHQRLALVAHFRSWRLEAFR